MSIRHILFDGIAIFSKQIAERLGELK